MGRRRLAILLHLALLAGCASFRETPRESTLADGRISELELQALAMEMADDYCAALGETVYLVLAGEDIDLGSRTLAVSFLRNSFGAALDIGSSPNPDVSVLDILVLAELNAWAFETHWAPTGGIDAERGAQATEQLRLAAEDLWRMASRVLSAAQRADIERLIARWIEEHPDQMVVTSVRFENFTRQRHMSTVGARETASGLLSEVSNASAAVEHARLFGERALWFASRYPWIIGQQAEVTTYRMADQPEFQQALASVLSVGELSEELAAKVRDLDATAETVVASFREERTATLLEAEATLARLVETAIDRLGEQVEAIRTATVEAVFQRLQTGFAAALDALEVRAGQLDTTLSGAEATAVAAATAGGSLHEALQVADRLAERFDRAPEDPRGSLHLEDLRETATEAHRAAEHLDSSLERVDRWIEDGRLDTEAVISAVFWRALILLALLLTGLALLRILPARASARGPD